MKCKQCGKELKQGAKFCVYCGARVDDVDLGQTVTVEPVEPVADADLGQTVTGSLETVISPQSSQYQAGIWWPHHS